MVYVSKVLLGLFSLTNVVYSAVAAPTASNTSNTQVVNQTTCNSAQFTYQSLSGYGFVPYNSRDKYGDTLGGIGSSIALEKGSWKKTGKKYTATLWGLPDRGWNTKGTLNYQSRVHKFKIEFEPGKGGATEPNLVIKYKDTVLLTDPKGGPVTGLDADAGRDGVLKFKGFPDLPAATYSGDGFGGQGKGGKRVSIDCEGLVVNEDGTFWISDEYGPYVYKFDEDGKMVLAIRPPDAFIPLRNGTQSFNSNTAPYYDPNRTVTPSDTTSGRANNQGFEGLTISPDGKTLSILTQSALMQEGGSSNKNRRYARMLQYDISNSAKNKHTSPTYLSEFVVPLPRYINNEGKDRIAAQSEILAISNTQFLVLARDSSAGRGQEYSNSIYRHVDVFDTSLASDIHGLSTYDATNGSIATVDGVLKEGVTPVTYCSWLDFNVNSELGKFGLHNGGSQDDALLAEKWESLALAPVDGAKGKDGEFYLLSFADNDFVTTDGYANFGRFKYSDDLNVNNQALVFKVQLPKGSSSYYI